jgi:hypothetical protein
MEGAKVLIKTGPGYAPQFTPSQARYIAKKLIQFADDIDGAKK